MPAETIAHGQLWPRVVKTTEQGLRCGSLQPLATERRRVCDQGMQFLIRVAPPPSRRAVDARSPAGVPAPNPFLPFDAALHVGDISETHVCLLNKFNVVDHHLLIVTRAFERQDTALGASDFAAAERCLEELGGLAFYNGGTVAGASQPHRHLQWIPLPLAENMRGCAVDPLIDDAECGRLTAAPRLPFRHRLWRAAGMRSAEERQQVYVEMLRALDRRAEHVPLEPYNLLWTRRWMLFVPRTHERFHGISLNGLAFAGALLARGPQQLETLDTHGPAAALAYAAGGPDGCH